jgi:hypothetical protein
MSSLFIRLNNHGAFLVVFVVVAAVGVVAAVPMFVV